MLYGTQLSVSYFYRPQTELREGKLFRGVCLSVILSTGGPCVAITRDALGHGTYPPPPQISDMAPTPSLSRDRV